jgi:chemotaxis protein histidine kinase CheA
MGMTHNLQFLRKMDTYFQGFIENTQEHLQKIEMCLIDFHKHQKIEVLSQILREITSIQANGEILGIQCVESIALRLQIFFKEIRNHKIIITQEIEFALFEILDRLMFLVQELQISFSLSQEIENKLIEETEVFFKFLNNYLFKLLNPRVELNKIKQIFPLDFAVTRVAKEYNKQVRVIVKNTHVLIDQSILKHFATKLLPPLINNAIAHGIEYPEEREKKGKPPMGRILITALNRPKQITLMFADDGGGIDTQKVKNKAISQGLITSIESEKLTEKQIYDFIYHPGFTTKQKKDLIAGLGFGMDIIRTELNRVGGIIKTYSIPQQGTNFKIIYPIT